jgi:hypothetical protein
LIGKKERKMYIERCNGKNGRVHKEKYLVDDKWIDLPSLEKWIGSRRVKVIFEDSECYQCVKWQEEQDAKQHIIFVCEGKDVANVHKEKRYSLDCLNKWQDSLPTPSDDKPIRFNIVSQCDQCFDEKMRPLTDKIAKLHNAIKASDLASLSDVVSNGEDVDLRDANGDTPLMIASAYGHEKIVKFLLDKGAYQNASSPSGDTPLSLAAFHGYASIVQLLIQRGVDLERRSGNMRATPLHLASRKGHKEVVQLLVAAGANVNALDDEGGSPAFGAVYYGFPEVARVLQQAGGKIVERGQVLDNTLATKIAMRTGGCGARMFCWVLLVGGLFLLGFVVVSLM